MSAISSRVHGAWDYLIGTVLIIGPYFLHELKGGGDIETTVPVTIGVIIFVYSFFTNYELGLFRLLPMSVHLILDIIAGIVLAASPWLWHFYGFGGYADLTHVLIGLLIIVIAIISCWHSFTVPNNTDDPKLRNEF